MQKQGLTDLHTAINMSVRQFDGKYDCVALIKKLIQQYQLPKYSIQFEILKT